MKRFNIPLPEKTDPFWAYFAGIMDGEGSLNIYYRQSIHDRAIGKGYARWFMMYVRNASIELLEFIQAKVGLGQVYVHKNDIGRDHDKDSYSLRFGHNEIRQILPFLIPHMFLKKPLASLMLDELTYISQTVPTVKREQALIAMDKKFRETALALPGNKCAKVRADSALRARLEYDLGKPNLQLFLKRSEKERTQP